MEMEAMLECPDVLRTARVIGNRATRSMSPVRTSNGHVHPACPNRAPSVPCLARRHWMLRYFCRENKRQASVLIGYVTIKNCTLTYSVS